MPLPLLLSPEARQIFLVSGSGPPLLPTFVRPAKPQHATQGRCSQGLWGAGWCALCCDHLPGSLTTVTCSLTSEALPLPPPYHRQCRRRCCRTPKHELRHRHTAGGLAAVVLLHHCTTLQRLLPCERPLAVGALAVRAVRRVNYAPYVLVATVGAAVLVQAQRSACLGREKVARCGGAAAAAAAAAPWQQESRLTRPDAPDMLRWCYRTGTARWAPPCRPPACPQQRLAPLQAAAGLAAGAAA